MQHLKQVELVVQVLVEMVEEIQIMGVAAAQNQLQEQQTQALVEGVEKQAETVQMQEVVQQVERELLL